MAIIQWTPVRIKPVINSPFRVWALLVSVVLSAVIIINANAQ